MTFFRVRLFLWKEQARVLFRYYRFFRFALLDLALGLLYLFTNPYRLCRKKMAGACFYGETPLTAWERIAQAAQIQKGDRFLDLGCGRGRLCFWTRLWIGCEVFGVDLVHPFIRRSRALVRLFGLQRIDFSHARMLNVNLKQATVIYLYAYHPDEEALDWASLQSQTRVITISEPLQRPGYLIQDKGMLQFPWGETEFFINLKI